MPKTIMVTATAMPIPAELLLLLDEVVGTEGRENDVSVSKQDGPHAYVQMKKSDGESLHELTINIDFNTPSFAQSIPKIH